MDVLEQAGGVKALDGVVDLAGSQLAARTSLEIRPDRIGLDPAIAFDNDAICRLRDRNARRRNAHDPGTDSNPAEDNTAKGQSP
jgi:hypothetical protein